LSFFRLFVPEFAGVAGTKSPGGPARQGLRGLPQAGSSRPSLVEDGRFAGAIAGGERRLAEAPALAVGLSSVFFANHG
jgi:hypothetical protein